MRDWPEVISFDIKDYTSSAAYMAAVSVIRETVAGIPIVIDEDETPVMVVVGCPGQGEQYLGDLNDLLEVAVSLKSGPDEITAEQLKAECS